MAEILNEETVSYILANVNISAGKKMKLTITDVNSNYTVTV